jgi:hypothetical protein
VIHEEGKSFCFVPIDSPIEEAGYVPSLMISGQVPSMTAIEFGLSSPMFLNRCLD